MVLFLWFETNAFYEYLKFLPFFRTYEEKKHLYDHPKYPEFLAIHHDDFLSKLLSCPYCLGFWTSLASTIYFSGIEFLPITYLSAILTYLSIKKLLNLLNN